KVRRRAVSKSAVRRICWRKSSRLTLDWSAFRRCPVRHARALYLKLRARSPKLNIVTYLWHFEDNAEQVAIRLRLAAGHRLFIILHQVLKFAALDSEKIDTSVPHHKIQIHLPGCAATFFCLWRITSRYSTIIT